MKLPQLSLRDLFWLVLVVAMGCGWWVERQRLRMTNAELQGEVQRLKEGPDWAGMDRIMDQYAMHWDLLQKRERELDIPETPNPFDDFPGDPQVGDPVPKVPAATWPDELFHPAVPTP